MTDFLLDTHAFIWLSENDPNLPNNQGSICNKLPENQLQKPTFDEEYKLEIAKELIKEGLTVEQIARVLKLPLELVKDEIKKDE